VRARVLVALVTACVTAVLVYAALRAGQVLFSREPNPATVIWSAHAGYYWRALTAAYAGGAAGIAAFLGVRRATDRVVALLARVVVVAACAITLQAVLAP
jgi:hypothetical protein